MTLVLPVLPIFKMKTLNYPLVLLVLSALACIGVGSAKECGQNKKLSTSKLICYYGTLEEIDGCYCSHIILPANSDVKGIEKVKERVKGVKIYVTVNEFNQGLINLLKTSKVDGLEIDLKKLDSKNDISDFISTVKTKLGSDLDIALSVPSKADLVAKYFDFKALSKHADLFILQTAFLGASTNVTFHPSRLSGMWDMQNADSVVDLVTGLGAPLSKLVVSAPVQAFQFTLQNEEYTAPGSPALELTSLTRNELCKLMRASKNWTLERDEDQAGPYIFSKNQWIAFEDSKSMDIKAKYSRVRGLAGLALKDLAHDGGSECGPSILEAAYNGLSRQARAPRGAVLHSLEREIADAPSRPLDSVQLSPYRISRIIDTNGKIHVNRQDSRTEFQCSRQGYFVHPRSCNRFYRCVKFDQLSDDYNVFEFDCPAGLAFDERVEVCVWPGSLPHGTPCSGSSEIAPVPRERFVCPSEPGYYADPENCRWFFACLDHGKSPLSAYEFRCPFGLVFDGDRLVCEWSWLVPKCASGLGVGLDSEYYYGGLGTANGLGEGYATIGSQSAGLILQSYNGLGALGTVKLGGVSGQIDKPISTQYSNVGTGNLGLGYQNSGGYIEGGGLSYKAAISLQNAGLLKVNNGVGYQAAGYNDQGTSYDGQGVAYSQHTGQSDLNGGALLINANGNYASGANSYAAGQLVASAELQDTANEAAYAQNTGQSNVNGGAFLINANGNYASGANSYAAGKLEASTGLQSTANGYQGVNIHLVQDNGIVNAGGQGATYQSAGAQGAVSSQSITQYHGAGQAFTLSDSGQYQNGARYINTGAVNVGGLDLNNNQNGGYVNIANDHRTSSGYASTGSFVSGGNNFDNKGFGANFQGSTGGAASTQSFTQFHGQQESKNTGQFGSGIAGSINIIGGGFSAVAPFSGIDVSNNGEGAAVKTDLIGAVTDGPAPKIASVPTVTVVPVPGIKTIPRFETIQGGVIANVPELQYKVKSLEDAGLFANISNSFANFVVTSPAAEQKDDVFNGVVISTARPFVSVTASQPELYISSTVKPLTVVEQKTQEDYGYSTPKPAVSAVTFQKYDNNGGYNYERPLVAFEENRKGVVVDTYSTVSTPSPVVTVQQLPQIVVSSTPATPAILSYNSNRGGYIYNKPSIAFEEKPAVIPKFTIRKPLRQNGYYYEKPSIKFEERPLIVQQSTVQNEIPTVHLKQKTVVEDYTYHQPAEVTQYYYQQPSVKTQPIVPLYQQPERLSTYTYQPPLQKQPVTTYTYQNVAQQAVGIQQPVQGYSYQPSGGTSYQYINLENRQQENAVNVQSQEGYVYNKPSIAFEERPQVDVVDTYHYSTPRPAVVVQEPKSQGGYVYEKPVTYSTVRPAVAAQPAVVTSYFNTGSSQASAAQHQEHHIGYAYSKPTVAFEVTPSSPKPLVSIATAAKPAVVTSYFNIASSKANAAGLAQEAQVGYNYPKPSVRFEETPIIYSTPKPQVVQPAAVSSYFNIANSKANSESAVQQQNTGYVYSKPSVQFQETPISYSTSRPVVVQPVEQAIPAVVTSYFNTAKANSESVVQQQNTGYVYQKPSVQFVETPVTYSTPKPVVVQPVEQAIPTVVTSYFNTAKANSGSVVQQQNTGYIYQKPSVHFEETPVTYSTPKPVVVQPVEQAVPAVVTSYFNTAKANSESAVQQHNTGYVYSKPSVQFVQTPVTYSTSRPVVVQPVDQAIPAEVTSYFNTAKANSETVVKQQNVGYSYPKPFVSFEETYSTPKPIQPVTPAVVTSYFNIKSPSPEAVVTHTTPRPISVQPVQPIVTSYVNFGSSTPRPDVYAQDEKIGYTYRQPEVKFEERPVVYSSPKPSVVSSYSYVAATSPKPVTVEENAGYTYQKPSYDYISSTTPQPNIVVEEQQPINYIPKSEVVVEQNHKPAVVTSYFHQQPSRGYAYPKPSVRFEEGPRQPVQEVPFVKKTAYVTGQYQQNSQNNYEYQQNYQHSGKVVVENYRFPEYEKVRNVVFGEKVHQPQEQVVLNYVQSTPRPTFISTIRPIIRKKLHPVTPAIVTSYDSRYTPTPETYLSSTVAPEVHVVSTTSRPISRFSFSSLHDQYQYNDVVKSTTAEPVRSYIPVTSAVRITSTSALPKAQVVEEYVAPEVTTLARDYLPVRVRTKAPAREYLPVEVTTPSKEYLPARRVKVTSTTFAPEITTLNREYLPAKTRVRVTTTGAPLEQQTYTIRPRKPSTIKVIRPVTVIKQNDAHPLLSAKLGAQCTCVSNTLRLRKKQRIIVVEDDDDNDDDGYVVDDENRGGNLVESYNYDPQRVVDITPTPEVYLPSSTVEPQTYVKKRVRVRPVTKQPASQVSDIFYSRNTSPAQGDYDSTPSDKEIAKAVRTGLKLVKQAARQGAKEGTSEVLAKKFDRYGPGGVRSRSESLQGTIDCQRAGLFRHPSECNKFYACRWDCTKNRFTLHVFNCPVHLTFDNSLGACNWPSQGPACVENTLITSD